MKNNLYVLVGVPGSGKTTWAQQQSWAEGTVHVSTDKFVEQYAKECGKTYSEVFADYMPTAIELMTQEVVTARENKKDIVWDQTSTTVQSRRRKLEMLSDYHKIAVFFCTPQEHELDKRLKSRPGKHIPNKVMSDMINWLVPPSLGEGFDEVRIIGVQ